MLNFIKKINQTLLLALTGLAFWFSIMQYTFSVVAMTVEFSGGNYTSMIVGVSVITALFSAFMAKLLVHVTFRIVGGIFTKKSGMLYPFPIHYGEFGNVVLFFSVLCFAICGIVNLPLLYFPGLSNVIGAIRNLITWLFLLLGANFFLKHYSHDYDRKALAVSLSVIPFVLIGLTTVLTIWRALV